jgi:hypothetical protein
VEILAELDHVAEENIAAHHLKSTPGKSATIESVVIGSVIESICMDAREFVFPETPLVVYLFNPLPEAGLRRVVENLEASWKKSARPVWIVYHNPLLEQILIDSPVTVMVKAREDQNYSLFNMAFRKPFHGTTE